MLPHYRLTGLPLVWGVVVTAFDVLLLLAVTGRSALAMEALIGALLAVVGAAFIYVLAQTAPPMEPVMYGFVPKARIFTNSGELYIATGIIGATVMPHNLYLHSALVLSRKFKPDALGRREAALYGAVDSTVALVYATFVNCAILIVAASAFSASDADTVSSLPDAARLLAPAVGSAAASTVFSVGLLASGQQSTLTGTLAGQVVMEGFLGGRVRLKPWARRLSTRALALVPAIAIAAGVRTDEGVAQLLNASQVVLSVQLPFAIFPLVQFTCRESMMGPMRNGWVLSSVGWGLFLIITVINAKLVVGFCSTAAGES
jgi:manganese transport protein